MKKWIAVVILAILCAVGFFVFRNVYQSQETNAYQKMDISQNMFVKKQKQHEDFAVVFYEPGSIACQLAGPVFQQLSKNMKNIPLYSLDVSRWAKQKQLRFFETYLGTPTWVYFENGERQYVLTGYNNLAAYQEALSYVKEGAIDEKTSDGD
ncbi:MAG TPA: thioredoxin family protein [Bacillales bacterium]